PRTRPPPRNPAKRSATSSTPSARVSRSPDGQADMSAAGLDDTKPVILVIDPKGDVSPTVEQLVARYSSDYTIIADSDGVSASQLMRVLAESAIPVALIL